MTTITIRLNGEVVHTEESADMDAAMQAAHAVLSAKFPDQDVDELDVLGITLDLGTPVEQMGT